MKNKILILTAAAVFLFSIARPEVIDEPGYEVAPYSIIDTIIKAVLEKMRPELANLKLEDINQDIKSPGFNATVKVKDIVLRNADTFVVRVLKSSVVPAKLSNLTLTWDLMYVTADYDFDISIAVPELKVPVRIYGKGAARASVLNTYLTIGANVELKDKSIQIKPKGLFGFNVIVDKANVTLSSLMGSPQLGSAVGDFIGKLIPEIVDNLKNPFFDAFHDTLVDVINDILKRHCLFMDEEVDLPEISFEDFDSNEEADSFDNGLLDFNFDGTKFDETEFEENRI